MNPHKPVCRASAFTRMFCLVLALAFCMPTMAAGESADLEMWRLDCGTMHVEDISYFSDSFAYDGESAEVANGCYLIRNGDRYLLWDMGLPLETLGNTTPSEGWTERLDVTLAQQLEQITLKPEDIDFVGISHFHGDHIGQAEFFAKSELLIHAADEAWLRARPPGNARRRLASWFEGGASMSSHDGDHDVFGDGRVVILELPGHTPGHSGLLVRLAELGPILLTGDLYHFRREFGKRNVSRWNSSRADTLASIERFEAVAERLRPTVVVQHEPLDVGLLPKFPASAR